MKETYILLTASDNLNIYPYQKIKTHRLINHNSNTMIS